MRKLLGCDRSDCVKILPSHDFHHSMTNPFCNGRRDRVPDGMIPQAVDLVRLALVEMIRARPVEREPLGQLSFVREKPSHPTIRIPDVVARPVCPCVPSRFSVNAVCDRLYERSPLSISNDRLKEGGRFLPIRSTRRRIPVAAFWLKKYFSGTGPVSMHGNNVDPTALLGDSEELTVKHTPRDVIPAPVQRLENDGEVTSSVARQKPVDVFEDNCSWVTRSNEAHKVVKQSRLAPFKSRSWPHSCKAEILAGESGCPHVSFWDFCVIENPDVVFER